MNRNQTEILACGMIMICTFNAFTVALKLLFFIFLFGKVGKMVCTHSYEQLEYIFQQFNEAIFIKKKRFLNVNFVKPSNYFVCTEQIQNIHFQEMLNIICLIILYPLINTFNDTREFFVFILVILCETGTIQPYIIKFDRSIYYTRLNFFTFILRANRTGSFFNNFLLLF